MKKELLNQTLTHFKPNELFVLSPMLSDINLEKKRQNSILISLPLSLEIARVFSRANLLGDFLNSVNKALRKLAYYLYCYTFSVPVHKGSWGWLDISVGLPDKKDKEILEEILSKSSLRTIRIKVSASLVDKGRLRKIVQGMMIPYVERLRRKEIKDILKEELPFFQLKAYSWHKMPSQLKEILLKEGIKTEEDYVDFLFRDYGLVWWIEKAKIKEWQELKKDLIKKGLIDENYIPKVPLSKIEKEIWPRKIHHEKCPFCGRLFLKWRKDQTYCGSNSCRGKKHRLKKKIEKIKDKDPKEIAKILNCHVSLVESILGEIYKKEGGIWPY